MDSVRKEPCSPHGWTLDTLEKYLSNRIDSVKEAVSIAMSSADKAISKSDIAIEKRLDSMNEFRAALNDQAKMLLPRVEYTIAHKSLEEKYDLLQTQVTSLLGKSTGMSTLGAILIGLLSTVISAIAVIVAIVFHFR